MNSADRGLPLKARERNELRKWSFNQVAELYDEARPGYPEPLFEDLVRLSGIPGRGRILEIGCGTGQATVPLARRGYLITCLELGDKLARLAARKCCDLANVEVRNVAFEDWPLEPEAFDLVVSASAFHWIRPGTGFPKVSAALKPSGKLALIWNFRLAPDDEFHRSVARLYKRYAPDIAKPKPPEERIRRQEKKIVGSGLFEAPLVRQYPWELEYTVDRYVGLLRTQSDHAIMNERTREALLGAVRGLIDSLGGRVKRSAIAVLFLTGKKPLGPDSPRAPRRKHIF